MEPSTKTRVLTTERLCVNLGGQSIFKDINLQVDAGDSLVVIGPNGSGKTVLLKALLGILPHEGEIDWAPGTRLGYVPQKVEVDLHLPLTLENLLEAKRAVMQIPKPDLQALQDTLKLPSNILTTPVGHLSGGQFQKALICLSLLGNPDVLLFDEPTASLDQLAEEHIYDLIHELQVKRSITILLVSHDLSIVYRYATKVLCLNRETSCFGPPQQVTPEVLERLYGSPVKYYGHEHS